MTRKASLCAAALTTLLLSTTLETAEARRRHHRGHHGGADPYALHQLHRDRQSAFGSHYSADPCYWLARRAISAGSVYLWEHYYSCLSGHRY